MSCQLKQVSRTLVQVLKTLKSFLIRPHCLNTTKSFKNLKYSDQIKFGRHLIHFRPQKIEPFYLIKIKLQNPLTELNISYNNHAGDI